MNDMRQPIEERLNKPRGVVAHLSAFSLWVLLLGIFTLLTPYYQVSSVLAFPIMFTVFWSLILPVHAGLAFLQSSAWAPAREKAVREDVLALAHEQSLTAEEAIYTHRRLSDDLRENALRQQLLPLFALAHTAIWFGGIVALIGLSFMGGYSLIANYQYDLLALAELGSFGLGLLLPMVLLWDARRRATGGVASFYENALKQKRKIGDDAQFHRRLALGEDGELVGDFEEDALQQMKR